MADYPGLRPRPREPDRGRRRRAAVRQALGPRHGRRLLADLARRARPGRRSRASPSVSRRPTARRSRRSPAPSTMRDAFADRARASCVADAARRLADGAGPGRDRAGDVLRAPRPSSTTSARSAIPVEVLNRRGELTAEEREAIERHPEVGQAAARERRCACARAAGGGASPRALGRDRLSRTGSRARRSRLLARAIAICDAYQAMIIDRPYRQALSQAAALAQLRAVRRHAVRPGARGRVRRSAAEGRGAAS